MRLRIAADLWVLLLTGGWGRCCPFAWLRRWSDRVPSRVVEAIARREGMELPAFARAGSGDAWHAVDVHSQARFEIAIHQALDLGLLLARQRAGADDVERERVGRGLADLKFAEDVPRFQQAPRHV